MPLITRTQVDNDIDSKIKDNNVAVPGRTSGKEDKLNRKLILNYIDQQDALSAGPYTPPANAGNVVYVSPTGSNTTGERGNSNKPYSTIAAAQAVFVDGDVIWIQPGTYTNQAQLGIVGKTARYYIPLGADITFSSAVINAASGSLIIRGNGKFSGTVIGFTSTGSIDMEFDQINLTANFYNENASSIRYKGRVLNLGASADWGLRLIPKAHFEVGTITTLSTGGTFFRENTGLIEFANTRFVMSGALNFYEEDAPYTQFVIYRFYNCNINATTIKTSSGPGTSNSFYGRLHFEDTHIDSIEDGLRFLKSEPGAEYWFDGVRISSGSGFHSMVTTAPTNAQFTPINIRILGGGLVIDKDFLVDATRPITNLQAGTYAVRNDYVGSAPATSRFSALKVIDEPGAGVGGVSDNEYIEYDNLAAFPATGEADLLYLAKDTNLQYRWNGSAYVGAGGSSETGATIKTKLELLTGANRLDSRAIKNLPYYNVKDFGAKGDGVMKFDGAMTSGSATLTSAGGTFATSDVGKRVVVTGAGAAGAPLVTTIASRTSATQVTLALSASTTVSNTKYHYGTPDRAAILSAISAAQAEGNGVLYFPGGFYEIESTITINKSIRIQGAGMAGGMANQISGGVLAKDRLGPVQYNSVLLMCENSTDGFVFETPDDVKPHVKIHDLHFEGDGIGKNTAGAFVVVKGMNQDMVIESTSFYGGFLQVDIQSAFHYHIDKCVFSAPAKAGLKTGNNIRTDTGDMSVTSSVFVPGTFDTATLGTMAIWWYAGGGMKIIGCKFDASSFLTATMFKYLVYCSNTLDATSDIIITANSFENWQVSAIKLEGIVDPYVRNIHITSNQFAASGSTGPCIDIDLMRDLIISDFLIRDWGGTVNQPAIKVTNCDSVTIGKGQIKDYTSNINSTGSTNTDIDYKWQAGQIGQAFTYPGVWSFVNNVQYADNFSRADNSSSLGNLTSPNTVAWIPAVGTWGISNNQAYCSSALGSGSTLVNIAYVDYASGNCSVEVDLTSVGGGISENGVAFRYLDGNNFWMLDVTLNGTTRNEVLYKKVAGGAFQSVAAASDLDQSPGTHTYKVVLSNNLISVYRDGVGIPELTNVVDNFNQLQTKVGLMLVSGSGYVGTTPRFDNFKVY